ncbi:MAG: murein biosynthesis integral membrane protein MurJ [Deltaproteobacteria bacterium]|nr:murein biosynthesis integral membrane protein MurJ [Deltaproteobacteria bacterium]
MSTQHTSNHDGKAAHLARSAGSVSVAVFFSRILGLVREQVLAGLFGAGTAMDAFVVAFRIPNLLRDLFAEGALSAAFITVFTEYDQKRSKEETWRLVNNVLAVLTVVISLTVILGMIFSNELVMLLAPDFAKVAGKVELTQRLTIIMFPFLLLVSLSSVLMGILNTKGYFFIPSLASSCFNMTSIVVGVGLALLFPLWGQPAIMGMAVGTLLGGLSQMGIQVPIILRQGFRIKPVMDLADHGLQRIGRLIVPAIIGLSATQINIFINTNFASRCAEGSVAWLNYAFRLVQFPIGLFGVAISIATLPVVARLATKGDHKVLGDTLVSSLTLAFALTIPAAVGLWVLAEPIVGLIFEHGRFSQSDTFMTAQALRFYSIGLLAYAAVKIVVPVFYALNDTRWPVIGSFLAVAVNICIILATLDKLQHRAIALSTSVTMILNFMLLATVLYRKIDGYPAGRLFMSLVKIFLASGIMGLLVWWVQIRITGSPGIWLSTVKVFASMSLGIVSYGILAYVLKLTEFTEIINKVIKRIRDL